MKDYDDNEERDEPEHSVMKFGPGGPPIFRDPAEMQEMIAGYFNGGYKTKLVEVGTGDNKKVIEIPMITITGLVLYLGFADRRSFYDYEKNPEFSYTIKRARTFIEEEYESLLKQGLGSGAIFALKNFGWIDRTEVGITADVADSRERIKEFLNEPDSNREHLPDNGTADLPNDADET